MRAMVLARHGSPLDARELPEPRPGPGEVTIDVRACAVCRTDLHVVDGELTEARLPLVPGHQIVGRVREVGEGVARFRPGDRAGVPWLAWACGTCAFCRSGRENLCDRARFTGYHVDGGFAERATADARFAFPLPSEPADDATAAPLLCAGLVGYRALRMTADAECVGFYGFGAAAHILCPAAVAEGRRVFAFTRDGDGTAQEFARSLGAAWAGGSGQAPPQPLDAAILFAPVGALVPRALAAVRKGGVVVCAGIHMSDIPAFPYALLWGERVLRSVANLTRADGDAFFALLARSRIVPHVTRYPLERANDALDDVRAGRLSGSAVLEIRSANSRSATAPPA